MTRSTLGSIIVLICTVSLIGGCDQEGPARPGRTPKGTTPGAISPTSAPAVSAVSMEPPADPRVASFHGLVAPVPAGWTWAPPSNSFRAANYVVPGTTDNDAAELVVFNTSIGGSLEQNIDRWIKQFQSDDGSVRPNLQELDVDGMPVTIVEIRGDHRGMNDSTYVNDRTMIQAVIETPNGKVFVRLLGLTPTIEASREAFMELIRGVRIDRPEPAAATTTPE